MLSVTLVLQSTPPQAWFDLGWRVPCCAAEGAGAQHLARSLLDCACHLTPAAELWLSISLFIVKELLKSLAEQG